jgi:hypothetical protein
MGFLKLFFFPIPGYSCSAKLASINKFFVVVREASFSILFASATTISLFHGG